MKYRDYTKVRNKMIATQVADGATYASVAARYGISATRVRGICAQAWRKLKTGLEFTLVNYRNPQIRLMLLAQQF